MKYLISKTQILKKGCMIIENRLQGEEEYSHQVIRGSADQLLSFLRTAYMINGDEASFADFYYTRLSRDEKQAFLASLTPNENEFLSNTLEPEIERSIKEDNLNSELGIYYRLDEFMLEFLAGITEREVLFSSFYFSRIPITIWGNYGHSYIIFYADMQSKELYEEIANKQGLILEEM